MTTQELAQRILARELRVGDIYCPEGIPPGEITKLAYDPVGEKSLPNYLMYFEYEGDICGKRTCDIRPDHPVMVYRGKLSDANVAWLANHPECMTLAQRILAEINLTEQELASMSIFKKVERLDDLKTYIKQLCQEEVKE